MPLVWAQNSTLDLVVYWPISFSVENIFFLLLCPSWLVWISQENVGSLRRWPYLLRWLLEAHHPAWSSGSVRGWWVSAGWLSTHARRSGELEGLNTKTHLTCAAQTSHGVPLNPSCYFCKIQEANQADVRTLFKEGCVPPGTALEACGGSPDFSARERQLPPVCGLSASCPPLGCPQHV